MATVVVTQVRSRKGSNPAQRATLSSLRLGRIGSSAEHPDSPQVRGMVSAVSHLVRVDGES